MSYKYCPLPEYRCKDCGATFKMQGAVIECRKCGSHRVEVKD